MTTALAYVTAASRLFTWRSLEPAAGAPDEAVARAIITGGWFRERGIAGFDGPDLPHVDALLAACGSASDLVLSIGRAFARSTAPESPADLLKTVYQRRVSGADRRRLGEYYTPDWLAHRIVRRVLADDPTASILDPTCGSGTFLLFAIHEKRRLLGDSPATLAHILESVRGADVSPLAQLMARANYLAAVAPLLVGSPPSAVPVRHEDLLAEQSQDIAPRADCVVGNPPWIPLRALPAEDQVVARRLAVDEYGLLAGRGEMATHLEHAAICLCRALDRCVNPGGAVAFVMPRTLLSADQHDVLRRGEARLSGGGLVALTALWDCEGVRPMFTVPACVVFARRRPDNLDVPSVASLPAERIRGALPAPEPTLTQAEAALTVERVDLHLICRGSRSAFEPAGTRGGTELVSPYRPRFAQGATIVPRSFWFVDLRVTSEIGATGRVEVRTAAQCKAGPVALYTDAHIDGAVPADYLYAVIRGDDVLPFGLRGAHPAVLPVRYECGRSRIVTASDARQRGDDGLADWLRKAECLWATLRGDKAGRMTTYERLDRGRGLLSQNPRAAHRVVYPNFQRVAVAAVVGADARHHACHGGVVVDTALYWCAAETAAEAHYLCALLNSGAVDRRLGELRRRDQAAHPNVHKKVFDAAPIPLFDAGNVGHVRLAALGEQCAGLVASALASREPELAGNLGNARRHVRATLSLLLAEIDALAERILP